MDRDLLALLGFGAIADADGDTIVNAKFGVRTHLWDGNHLYIGYGTALTSDVWYDEILPLLESWGLKVPAIDLVAP